MGGLDLFLQWSVEEKLKWILCMFPNCTWQLVGWLKGGGGDMEESAMSPALLQRFMETAWKVSGNT